MKYQIEFLSEPRSILINFSECAELLHSIKKQRQFHFFSDVESFSRQGSEIDRKLLKVDGFINIFASTELLTLTVECCGVDFGSYIITDCNSEEFVKECSRFVNLIAINEKFLDEWDHKIQQILMIVKSCCPDGMCVDMGWKKYIAVPSMHQYDCRTQHRH